MPEISLQEIAEIADSFEAGTQDANAAGAITWRSASLTDVGRVRHINEDAFLDSQEQRLWVVADGMGGHSRGDFASSAVVKQLRTFSPQGSVLANLQDLETRLQAANVQCRTAFRKHRPGTTVVVMLAHGNQCFFLWAGDSRLYRLRDGELVQLTEDHSLAQQKHARGELTAEEKVTHHTSHVLTRAVGIRESLTPDLGFASVHDGDRYLLCSDGLYNPVGCDDIQTLLAQGAAQDSCKALVDLALERGGRDNITAIVVDASAPA
ncbi:PP2C family protein-serine/threonine phosphatase [Haliea sp. E17]|uniref:PP2C family protein-serine/threonine phosphatase n=1 Tax=Haliea sp. E17 TaxID=3401576 RepID=UPI003AACC999